MSLTTYKFAKKAYSSSKKNKPQWGLVKKYIPLLKSIVGHMKLYFPEQNTKEDIYSVGLLGLIHASQNYSPQQSKSFSAYASIKIKGALLDELRRLDWLPRSSRVKLKQYRKQIQELEENLGHTPSCAEICKSLNLTPNQFIKLNDLNRPLVCLPLELGYDGNSQDDEGKLSLSEVLSDVTQASSREFAEKKELLDMVKNKLKELPKQQQKVLALHYQKGFRLIEIAKAFNLTQSRICQIHNEALKTIREKILKEI